MIGRLFKNILGLLAFAARALMFGIAALISYFSRHKKRRRRLEWVLLALLLVWVAYALFLAPPPSFPVRTMITVKSGTSLVGIASQLREKGIINSATVFEIVARFTRHGGVVVAGEYAFSSPQNMITVARRITSGDFELEPVKVRVEEGMSAEQIAILLGKSVPDFDMAAFLPLAESKEGMLYPDTYFILPGEEPQLVVSLMTSNFNSHIRDAAVAAELATFGKPLHDVLTMASILEKEASLMQDRRIIAGILWQRIGAGMKLQVDAVFPYINGKNSFTLTKADLAIDSPYNTYVYPGLPPGPIGSPSIDAIRAAVTPVTTSYVYYLSDLKGQMHYATTYAQHLANKAKYLDK